MDGFGLALVIVCHLAAIGRIGRASGGRREPLPPESLPETLVGSHTSPAMHMKYVTGRRRMVSKRTSRTYSSNTVKRLEGIDPTVAQLEYIHAAAANKTGCTNRTHNHLTINVTRSFLDRYKNQSQIAIDLATTVSNFLDPKHVDAKGDFSNRRRTHAASSTFNSAVFYSMLKVAVQRDPKVVGCAIAFDKDKFLGKKLFLPYALKDPVSGAIEVQDMSKVYGDWYTTRDNPWFNLESTDTFRNKHIRDFTCRNICLNHNTSQQRINSTLIQLSRREGKWTGPNFDCHSKRRWILKYSVPFFGCKYYCNELEFKGVVTVDVDLSDYDINQCESLKESEPFRGTHHCPRNSECIPITHKGFRRGSYNCRCNKGYFRPGSSDGRRPFYGEDIEREYVAMLVNNSPRYNQSYYCLPCFTGCESCRNQSPCVVEHDDMLRGIPLGIQSFCMTIALVLGLVIIRLRKTKVMKSSMWIMLEIIIVGSLLLYATVVIRYFTPNTTTCLLIPWFREVGFAILYGALILKVYRVLADFQSRKAHRVYVRDKDLLKYLACITLVVAGYMSAWTAINMDYVREGKSMLIKGETSSGLKFNICKSFWWDYVVEVGEFLFLCLGLYICYCIRQAPSDYSETKYISWALTMETIVSALLHITRHIIWDRLHPDYTFLLYFVRCQLTVTFTLILVLGPKFWFTHRPPEDFRGRAYSTSEAHDSILPESMKLQVGVNSNGDVDVGEINLAEMDPEDIRAELKRLYTQLQIYKTKTMRKDNPHISKRRGGRKQTHRRFSLQAFHYKHKHHHDHDHEHEMSRTPEESTNSAEGVSGISVGMESSIREEYSHCQYAERTPTVTFKPGHKTLA